MQLRWLAAGAQPVACCFTEVRAITLKNFSTLTDKPLRKKRDLDGLPLPQICQLLSVWAPKFPTPP